jgi:hypothetical protein
MVCEGHIKLHIIKPKSARRSTGSPGIEALIARPADADGTVQHFQILSIDEQFAGGEVSPEESTARFPRNAERGQLMAPLNAHQLTRHDH